MSKFYEVPVLARKVLLIEVEDHEGTEEAMKIAMEEAFPFVEMVEVSFATLLATEDSVEKARQHADEVFLLED